MKIVLINHSDTLGGASVVTRRLMHALRDIGHDAYMLVGRRLSDDPYVIQAAPTWRTRIPFLAETARIYIDNGFNRDDLFKVSLGSDGLPLSRHPLVRDADAIILAWVNQGLLSLDEIERIGALGRPLLWIMHDLWCATALCHHPATCTHYLRQSTHDSKEQGCHHCPMLHSRAAAKDASHRTWQRKKALYSNTPIRFVAVSTWLAEKCRQSSLMANADIH
ncbi:MAG: glycosyl transferase, partial [Muribaculaceae bacterium]|nr:glycosyl transferase [Muribaculaceae bacterium]